MAIPSIISLSPTSGPAAGGNLVVINGADFSVGYGTTYPTTNIVPVAVTFGGQAALEVWVQSAIELWAKAPPLLSGDPTLVAHAPVAITVQNLDSTGAAIPGELATRASAYTYLRYDLAPSATRPVKDGPTSVLVDAFLARLVREVARNTAMQTHVDFGDQGSVTVVKMTEPSIQVRTTWSDDVDYNQWNNVRERKGTEVYRPAIAKMCQFDLLVSAQHEGIVNRMLDSIRDMQGTYPFVVVPQDPDWTGGAQAHPLELVQDAMQVSEAGMGNNWMFSMRMAIRGYRIIPGTVIDQTIVAQTVVITLGQLNP